MPGGILPNPHLGHLPGIFGGLLQPGPVVDPPADAITIAAGGVIAVGITPALATIAIVHRYQRGHCRH